MEGIAPRQMREMAFVVGDRPDIGTECDGPCAMWNLLGYDCGPLSTINSDPMCDGARRAVGNYGVLPLQTTLRPSPDFDGTPGSACHGL